MCEIAVRRNGDPLRRRDIPQGRDIAVKFVLFYVLKAMGGIGNAAIQAIAGAGGSALAVQGSIIPVASGLYDVGSSNYPLRTLYVNNPILTSHVELNSSTTVSATNGATVYVIWTNKTVDTLSEFNNSTGVFTALATGVYSVCLTLEAIVTTYIASEQMQAMIFKITGTTVMAYGHDIAWTTAANQELIANTSACISMNAGDQLCALYKNTHAGGTVSLVAGSKMTITRVQ